MGEDTPANALSASSSSGAQSNSKASPDPILAELQTLRKKYDAVVEYTVHLTTERDSINMQLESAQRELIKEKAKRKPSSAAASAGDGSNGTATVAATQRADKKSAEKASSLAYLYRLLTFNFFHLLRVHITGNIFNCGHHCGAVELHRREIPQSMRCAIE